MKGFLNKRIVMAMAVLLAFVFALIFWSYNRLEDRLVVTVDGYGLEKSKGVTVGRNSDVLFDKVPEAFLSLSFTKDSMYCRVNKSADTLMYYKINGDNPNLFPLNSDNDIIIKRYGRTTNVSLKTIESIFDRYSKPSALDRLTGDKPVKYMMLRHLVALMDGVDDNVRSSALADDTFQSFVYHNGSVCQLCILDKDVVYAEEEYKDRYTVGLKEGMFQVQFFKMVVNSYRKDEPSNTDVEIDGICYAAKPSIITTKWGAGHVSFRPRVTKNKVAVDMSFPKSITYVENLDSLKTRAARTSDMMSVSQVCNSFPVFNNLYLAAFSDGVVPDFASVSFKKRGRNIFMIDTCNDTTQLKRQSWLYPLQQKVSLRSDADAVYVRTAVLDTEYWMSYLFFPTLVYVLMLLFSFIVFNDSKRSTGRINPRRVEDFMGYFNMLLTVMFAYVLCKIFIVIKLSFTYPYFEKLSGIVVTSTSLMLLLTTSLAFLFNFSFAERKWITRDRYCTSWQKLKGFFADRTFLSAMLVLAVAYALCVLSMLLIDNGNSLSMKESYMNSSLTIFSNPLKWTENAGINDTHRSVCYALFLIETIILVVLLVRGCMGLLRPILNRLRVPQIFEAVSNGVKNAYATIKDTNDFGFAATVLTAIIFLFGATFLPGNFATAVITFVVVMAMSRMVILYQDLKLSNWWRLGLKMLGYGAVLFFAIIPDQGYVVASIGLLVAILLFPITTCRVEHYNLASIDRARDTVRGYILGVILAITVAMAGFSLVSARSNPENVSWGRLGRRMDMFFSYDKTREAGYRYSEADMEFMQIMCHYMQKYSTSEDPLSNDANPLHKSVSTGQSPVVLNDVSAQAAFFGPIGWPAHLIFFALIAVLVGVVMTFSFAQEYAYQETSYSFRLTRERLVAMLIWVGASAYLYRSYLGGFPYTGRLIHGFGVDSVGEALEICVLVALMSHVAISTGKETK